MEKEPENQIFCHRTLPNLLKKLKHLRLQNYGRVYPTKDSSIILKSSKKH
ncbi:hypothetical protein V1478_005614 [Vespula squamosa]|uniref:Uncharacterized protein n=1 Tax=Vespula squamosa TaxID=30214 RepID=A0ABD2BAH0_VESSQ